LQAEAAGGSTLLKNIVVRLEDARILENVDDMRKRLVQLKTINGDLIREHEIRVNSHRELATSLKELNVGVQRATRLRGRIVAFAKDVMPYKLHYHVPFAFIVAVGKAAANAMARCRAAIQDENPKALVLAIKHG